VSTRAEVANAFCVANGHRFVEAVGSGAFKETFHIVLATGEAQALKVYKPGVSLERTSRELSAMQRCSHPNIGRLTAFADFYHDGVPYLLSIEEFLSGGTLTARLQRGFLNTGEAKNIGSQLVSAVAHIASHDHERSAL
jgi:serine/threonine protein kinase